MIGLISYLTFFLTIGTILAIAVMGLNLQWGHTGLFNGGVAAFFGAGAYGTLILGGTPQAGQMGGYEWVWPLALAGGVVAAGLVALLVGLATLRLRHDYLAIATFGVAVAFENLVRNAEWLGGGAKGLRGFERPLERAIGDPFTYNLMWLAICLACLIVTYLALEKLIRAPYGRLLRAIREDEVAARALGKPPARIRLVAFILGSMVMGLAGGLYASFYAFVSPQDVLPILTFQIWAMLIVGGAGNNRGAILGAYLIWGAWTGSGWALARFAPVEAQLYTGSIQYILIGIVIVGALLWRPEGILPERLVVSQRGRSGNPQPGRGAPRPAASTNQGA